MFPRHRFVRKEKVIPSRSLGVQALPPTSRIMISILEWLKNERLHKYWPIFSRMNYQTIVGLREDNIQQALANIDADEMTHGARGRILRCAEWLRARPNRLDGIDESTPLDEVCQTFNSVLETPLSTADEPYGISLIRKLCQKLQYVVLTHGLRILRFPGFGEVLISFANKEDIPEHEREFAKRTIRNMNMLWDLVTPPPSRTPSPSQNAMKLTDQGAPLSNGKPSGQEVEVAGSRNAWFPAPEQQPGVHCGPSGLQQQQPIKHQNGISVPNNPQDLSARFSSLSMPAHSLRPEQANKPCRQPAQQSRQQQPQIYRPTAQAVRPLPNAAAPPGFPALCKPSSLPSVTSWGFFNPQVRPSCSYIPLSTVAPRLAPAKMQPSAAETFRVQTSVAAQPYRMQPPVVTETFRVQTSVTAQSYRMQPAVTETFRVQPSAPVEPFTAKPAAPVAKPSKVLPAAIAPPKVGLIEFADGELPVHVSPGVKLAVNERGELLPKPSTWPPPPYTGEPWTPSASAAAPGIQQLYEVRQMGWFQPISQPLRPVRFPVEERAWPDTPLEKQRVFQMVKDSYTRPTALDNLDVNAIWGGRENQVLPDLSKLKPFQ